VRISHRNLEWLRRDPNRVARLPHGGGWNATMALYRAVRIYHDSGETEALDRLETDLASMNGGARTHLAYLAQYIDSYVAQGNAAFQYPMRIGLELGSGIVLGGEVARIDLVPGDGYAAWLLRPQAKPRNWAGHLNMPLLQLAVATELGVAVTQVSIGYYWFAPDEYSQRSYSEREVSAALREARALAVELARHGAA
jgi:hypothetical protein